MIDLEQFRGLYREHYGFVWRAVRRFGVPACDLDDAVQETFMLAYRRRSRYVDGSPRAWLYQIGRRVASNRRRADSRRASRIRSHPRGWGARPLEHDEVVLARKTLDAFLGRLDDGDRELFVLGVVEGLTGPEIAASTGRKPSTAYGRIAELRRRFGAFLEGDAEASIRAARATPRAKAAGWVALASRLQEPSGWAGLGNAWPAWWSTSLGGTTAGIVLGAGILGTIALGAHAARERPAAPARTDARDMGPPDDRRAPSPTPAVAATARSPQASPPLAGVAAEPWRAPAKEPSPRPRRADEAPVPPSPVPAPVAPSDSTRLAEDMALLRSASSALRAGLAARALELLDDHEQRFASTPHPDLRAALRIDALCGLHRDEEARTGAAQLRVRWPTTPMLERVRRSCAKGS